MCAFKKITLKVRIPDCPGPERVMSVVAADPQMVVKVTQQIQIHKKETQMLVDMHENMYYHYTRGGTYLTKMDFFNFCRRFHMVLYGR